MKAHAQREAVGMQHPAIKGEFKEESQHLKGSVSGKQILRRRFTPKRLLGSVFGINTSRREGKGESG